MTHWVTTYYFIHHVPVRRHGHSYDTTSQDAASANWNKKTTGARQNTKSRLSKLATILIAYSVFLRGMNYHVFRRRVASMDSYLNRLPEDGKAYRLDEKKKVENPRWKTAWTTASPQRKHFYIRLRPFANGRKDGNITTRRIHTERTDATRNSATTSIC